MAQDFTLTARLLATSGSAAQVKIVDARPQTRR
jgi:hypothetical protein